MHAPSGQALGRVHEAFADQRGDFPPHLSLTEPRPVGEPGDAGPAPPDQEQVAQLLVGRQAALSTMHRLAHVSHDAGALRGDPLPP